jgi:hypothetical protein
MDLVKKIKDILVIYDDPLDPIVQLIKNENIFLNKDVTLILTTDFIEKIQVNDTLTKENISIEWIYTDAKGQIKRWTNEDTYLVSSCFHLNQFSEANFHPDDEEYAKCELNSYFHFAFTAFKFSLQKPSYYGLSGPDIPLFAQWNCIKNNITNLHTPNYYIGPSHFIGWDPAVISSDPCDVTNWTPEKIDKTLLDQYIFAYERPPGSPFLIYITPAGADIMELSHSKKVEIDRDLIKSLAVKSAYHLGISIGEVLLFVSDEEMTFGSATPRVIRSQNSSKFRELTLTTFINTLSCNSDAEDNHFFYSYEVKNLKANDTFISIGLSIDKTTSTLTSSDGFKNNAIHLPLEEITKTWNFVFSDGLIKFYRGEELIETINAIYYRPSSTNDSKYDEKKCIWLLQLCLNSYNGIVYGRSCIQHPNSSKALQLLRLIPIIAQYSNISCPETFIIKGKSIFSQKIFVTTDHYITKSISSIRSIVVTNDVFSTWDLENLNYLPTLFQKQIDGPDIRVHVCGNKFFAIKISTKASVDYRYSETSDYEIITLPEEVEQFCRQVCCNEKNMLMGIDLIETREGYIFLEANPMPGWDFFYRKNNQIKEEICTEIMKAPITFHFK